MGGVAPLIPSQRVPPIGFAHRGARAHARENTLEAFELALRLGPGVEASFFGSDFKHWLSTSLGLVYDQRNSLVVGLAMGFAVIPIIFTISEDSFSSVPSHLTAASLALGASRWQTALRVVLPTASPGIFSAVMVGFGRAVGEEVHADLLRLLAEKRIRPVVGRRVSLEEAGHALDDHEARRTAGRTVVRIGG